MEHESGTGHPPSFPVLHHVALSLKNPTLYYSRPQVQIKSNGSDAFGMLILEPMLSTIKLHVKNGWARLGDEVEGQPLQLILDLVPRAATGHEQRLGYWDRHIAVPRRDLRSLIGSDPKLPLEVLLRISIHGVLQAGEQRVRWGDGFIFT